MDDLLQRHGPGTSAYLFGCECEVCGPWVPDAMKRPVLDYKDLTPEQVIQAKRLAAMVADCIPPGATAEMFRRASSDTVPGKRLLVAIHQIRETTHD